jgi:hypothetical protein
MRCLRLPFTFDPDKLRADLTVVRDDEWRPHLNRHVYDGEWSGAALRAIGGDGTNIVPAALNGGQFADTPLLARCDYFQHVLAQFRCPLLAVRLLRLKAGSQVGEHVDRGLDFEDGEVRIHVPIVTSDAVKFFLDGARLVMKPGECWYTNVNLPHAVENDGAIDRVHLVIDCTVDEWLRELFARTPRAPDGAQTGRMAAPMPIEPAQFYHICHRIARRIDRSPRCTVEAQQAIFSWRDTYTWQLRLRGDFSSTSSWNATWETSPAGAPALAARLEQFIAAWSAELPGLICERTSTP